MKDKSWFKSDKQLTVYNCIRCWKSMMLFGPLPIEPKRKLYEWGREADPEETFHNKHFLFMRRFQLCNDCAPEIQYRIETYDKNLTEALGSERVKEVVASHVQSKIWNTMFVNNWTKDMRKRLRSTGSGYTKNSTADEYREIEGSFYPSGGHDNDGR